MRITILRYQTLEDFLSTGEYLADVLDRPYRFLNEWCVMVGSISFIRDTHNVCWLATSDATIIRKLSDTLKGDPDYELNPGFYL